jgi:nickel/cobalt exporter
VALGLTVTATHTVSVFALGLITLAASEYILPEDLYPWLGIASGLMVVAIGASVMRSRYRRWRELRDGGHSHDHDHSPGHAPGDEHPHAHDQPHAHDHSDGGAPIRTRELLGLGVSGGLVPCPSALVVLVAAISQHRIGFGMVLILAFSVGLAATVTAVGLVTIWSRRLVARVRPEQRLFGGRLSGAMPAISASVIVLVGLLITYRAIPTLG